MGENEASKSLWIDLSHGKGWLHELFFFLVRFQVGLENKLILKPCLKDKIPSYKQVGKAEIQKL